MLTHCLALKYFHSYNVGQLVIHGGSDNPQGKWQSTWEVVIHRGIVINPTATVKPKWGVCTIDIFRISESLNASTNKSRAQTIPGNYINMIIIVSLATDDLSSVVNWFIQIWKGGQEKENYPGSLL